MATNSHLVLAFFPNEAEADGAADALRGWAKGNRSVQLDAIGVLVKDDDGKVKTQKLGPRESRKGLAIGAALGVVAAVASGGVSLLEGVAVGGAGGGITGSLFHKSLGMSKEDAERIGDRLAAGHAAVGALAPPNQADPISAELEALGGEAEIHAVSADDLQAATATT